jgi:type III restriction enzyme
MSKWVRRNSGFILWIVPNEAIFTQTRKALTNRQHPYRQHLDRAAAGKVKILEKNDALKQQDVESHLCVMLLMLQSANRETQETLRMFRDRGNVHGFFPAEDDYLAHHEVLIWRRIWTCTATVMNWAPSSRIHWVTCSALSDRWLFWMKDTRAIPRWL